MLLLADVADLIPNPDQYLRYGVEGAVCFLFALVVGAGIIVIYRITKDAQSRDDRLIAVLEKNATAMQGVGEKMAVISVKQDGHEMNMASRFDDLHDLIRERHA